MSRRVLITGIASYTGSRVALKFQNDGWDVHGLVRVGSRSSHLHALETHRIAIHRTESGYDAYREICSRIRCDVICHLAAASAVFASREARPVIETNVVFGAELVEAALESGCQAIVIAGSYWTHFDGPQLAPNSLYAATKIAFRYIVDYYARFRHLRAIELRMFDSYGPEDDRRKFLSWFDQAADGQVPVIMTEGTQILAPIHIDDVTEGYRCASELLLTSPPAFNSGCLSYALPGPELLTLREMARMYEKARNVTLNIRWGGRPYPVGQIMKPHIGEILPGWKPNWTFEAGIRSIYTNGQM